MFSNIIMSIVLFALCQCLWPKNGLFWGFASTTTTILDSFPWLKSCVYFHLILRGIYFFCKLSTNYSQTKCLLTVSFSWSWLRSIATIASISCCPISTFAAMLEQNKKSLKYSKHLISNLSTKLFIIS